MFLRNPYVLLSLFGPELTFWPEKHIGGSRRSGTKPSTDSPQTLDALEVVWSSWYTSEAHGIFQNQQSHVANSEVLVISDTCPTVWLTLGQPPLFRNHSRQRWQNDGKCGTNCDLVFPQRHQGIWPDQLNFHCGMGKHPKKNSWTPEAIKRSNYGCKQPHMSYNWLWSGWLRAGAYGSELFHHSWEQLSSGCDLPRVVDDEFRDYTKWPESRVGGT